MSPKRHVNRAPQRRSRAPQPDRQPRDLDRAPLDLGRKTYLSVRNAVDYLDFASEKAFRCWVDRYAVRKYRAGRTLRFKRTDLDEALKKAGKQVSA